MPKESEVEPQQQNEKVLEPLDLSKPAKGRVQPTVGEVSRYSLAWAGVVQPITWFVLWLICGVMMVPFILMVWFQAERDLVEPVMQWASTIFPPVVGFGSAIMGFYFGTRSEEDRRRRQTENASESGDEVGEG